MRIDKIRMFNRATFKQNSKNIFLMSMPVFIELFLNNLLGTVDTLMIGNFDPSGKAIAAISDANILINFLVMLFTICSVGVGIVVSHYIGANNKNTHKILSQGIMINLVLSLIITLIFVFTSRYILIAIKVPEEILETCNIYLFIVSFSLPFQALVRVLSSNLKSYGKPFYISIIYIICNGLNILLNYILIFGKLGIPTLGVKGAAIATLVCHISICALCLIFTKVKLKLKIFTIHFDSGIIKEIVKIGFPSAMEMICYNFAQLIVIAQVNKLSSPIITARSYVFLFQTYIYMFSSCIGNANAILVGYSIGKRDYQNAKNTTGLSSLYAYPIVLILISIINIFGFLIFPLFIKDQTILDNIYKILPLVFLVELSRCANLIYINALKSSGDTLFPVVVGIIFMFLVASLGSYLFGIIMKLGLSGVYLAIGLDEFFRAILCYVRWKKGRWTSYIVKKD